MTYASWPEVTSGSSPESVANSPTRAVSTSADNRPTVSSATSTSSAPLSATMNSNRSEGYSGSNGTYAPPAFHTANMATTISAPRGRHKPTRDSRPTPRATRPRATTSERASNSPYDSGRPPNHN